MRVGILSVPAVRKAPPDYVEALAKGVRLMGHSADIVDGWNDDGRRLAAYEYIIVAAEQTGIFGGRMPEALGKSLRGALNLSGKRSAAFLKKTGPFTGKALSNLMRAMEKEGMLVNWSEILLSAPHAEALGKRIAA